MLFSASGLTDDIFDDEVSPPLKPTPTSKAAQVSSKAPAKSKTRPLSVSEARLAKLPRIPKKSSSSPEHSTLFQDTPPRSTIRIVNAPGAAAKPANPTTTKPTAPKPVGTQASKPVVQGRKSSLQQQVQAVVATQPPKGLTKAAAVTVPNIQTKVVQPLTKETAKVAKVSNAPPNGIPATKQHSASLPHESLPKSTPLPKPSPATR